MPLRSPSPVRPDRHTAPTPDLVSSEESSRDQTIRCPQRALRLPGLALRPEAQAPSQAAPVGTAAPQPLAPAESPVTNHRRPGVALPTPSEKPSAHLPPLRGVSLFEAPPGTVCLAP